MSNIFPFTTNFLSDSYFNAFILNALVTALIAAIAIELRMQLNDKESSIYYFFNTIIYGRGLHIYETFLIEFFITFIIAFLVYQMMYVMFNFGGGMMIENNKKSYF
jgi:hypothetical protein